MLELLRHLPSYICFYSNNNSKKQGGYNVRDGNMVKSKALPDAGTLLFKN